MDIRDIVVEKDDGSTVFVGYSVWEKVKYEYNTKTKTLDSVVVGTFSQLPIKLGWAITINKSNEINICKLENWYMTWSLNYVNL